MVNESQSQTFFNKHQKVKVNQSKTHNTARDFTTLQFGSGVKISHQGNRFAESQLT
jgi:hypothetical protein